MSKELVDVNTVLAAEYNGLLATIPKFEAAVRAPEGSTPNFDPNGQLRRRSRIAALTAIGEIAALGLGVLDRDVHDVLVKQKGVGGLLGHALSVIAGRQAYIYGPNTKENQAMLRNFSQTHAEIEPSLVESGIMQEAMDRIHTLTTKCSYEAQNRVFDYMTPDEEERYMQETVKVGHAFGVDNPPHTVAELEDRYLSHVGIILAEAENDPLNFTDRAYHAQQMLSTPLTTTMGPLALTRLTPAIFESMGPDVAPVAYSVISGNQAGLYDAQPGEDLFTTIRGAVTERPNAGLSGYAVLARQLECPAVI